MTERQMQENNRISCQAFKCAFEEVLNDNNHKGGWKDCEIEYLIARLQQEVGELAMAIVNDYTDAAIEKECCDVANFAMMIFERY